MLYVVVWFDPSHYVNPRQEVFYSPSEAARKYDELPGPAKLIHVDVRLAIETVSCKERSE